MLHRNTLSNHSDCPPVKGEKGVGERLRRSPTPAYLHLLATEGFYEVWLSSYHLKMNLCQFARSRL